VAVVARRFLLTVTTSWLEDVLLSDIIQERLKEGLSRVKIERDPLRPESIGGVISGTVTDLTAPSQVVFPPDTPDSRSKAQTV
jgi:hypothetical protein